MSKRMQRLTIVLSIALMLYLLSCLLFYPISISSSDLAYAIYYLKDKVLIILMNIIVLKMLKANRAVDRFFKGFIFGITIAIFLHALLEFLGGVSLWDVPESVKQFTFLVIFPIILITSALYYVKR